MERAEVLRRAILQDRLDGALYDRTVAVGDDDWTEAHNELSSVLTAIVADVLHVHPDDAGLTVERIRGRLFPIIVDECVAPPAWTGAVEG